MDASGGSEAYGLFNGSSGYMGMGLNQKSFAAAYIPETLLPGADISGYIMTIERI